MTRLGRALLRRFWRALLRRLRGSLLGGYQRGFRGHLQGPAFNRVHLWVIGSLVQDPLGRGSRGSPRGRRRARSCSLLAFSGQGPSKRIGGPRAGASGPLGMVLPSLLGPRLGPGFPFRGGPCQVHEHLLAFLPHLVMLGTEGHLGVCPATGTPQELAIGLLDQDPALAPLVLAPGSHVSLVNPAGLAVGQPAVAALPDKTVARVHHVVDAPLGSLDPVGTGLVPERKVRIHGLGVFYFFGFQTGPLSWSLSLL